MSNLQNVASFFSANTTDLDIVSVLIPAVLAFVVGIFVTPILTSLMYRHKLWRQKDVSATVDGRPATITRRLNNDKQRKVPRMGGLVVIIASLVSTAVFWLLSSLSSIEFFDSINFVSRGQTWLPIFALVVGATIGAFDDLITVGKLKVLERRLGGYLSCGMPLKMRITFVAILGLVCGYWFFSKLGVTTMYIPFWQELEVGLLIIPIVMIVTVAVYSGGIIDGVDGLAPGVFTTIFGTYTVIAALQGQYDLAAFCLVLVGGLLAFLWFNIPPARFFMSDTGTMALTLTLSLIAFITDTVLLLPIIALPLLVSSLSVIVQVLSKKFRNGRKVFKVSPLHNHFRASGWPDYKVTMRYWVIAQVTAMSGLIIFILGY